jgi:NADPH2:quinone reductase
LHDYVATRDELVQRSTELFSWVKDGALKVRIGAEFPLVRAADAHRALASRKTTGKVVLIP